MLTSHRNHEVDAVSPSWQSKRKSVNTIQIYWRQASESGEIRILNGLHEYCKITPTKAKPEGRAECTASCKSACCPGARSCNITQQNKRTGHKMKRINLSHFSKWYLQQLAVNLTEMEEGWRRSQEREFIGLWLKLMEGPCVIAMWRRLGNQ